jgi:hypothetical protein
MLAPRGRARKAAHAAAARLLLALCAVMAASPSGARPSRPPSARSERPHPEPAGPLALRRPAPSPPAVTWHYPMPVLQPWVLPPMVHVPVAALVVHGERLDLHAQISVERGLPSLSTRLRLGPEGARTIQLPMVQLVPDWAGRPAVQLRLNLLAGTF